MAQDAFPFKLTDLLYWVVRRKDGTVCKYIMSDKPQPTTPGYVPSGGATSYYGGASASYSYSTWCEHTPAAGGPPLFALPNGARLFIADAAGLRKTWNRFDYVLDAGSVLSDYQVDKSILKGDRGLISRLEAHTEASLDRARVIKIDWTDRSAPEVLPTFWEELKRIVDEAPGDLVVACQGGHGRPGTSAVCFMMVNSLYSPKEAIIHLRALHCPRAIESKVQHDYLNTLAAYLGRPQDAHEAEGIKNYRAAFRELAKDSSTAAQYVSQLKPEQEEKARGGAYI